MNKNDVVILNPQMFVDESFNTLWYPLQFKDKEFVIKNFFHHNRRGDMIKVSEVGDEDNGCWSFVKSDCILKRV
jgi:hypothetical protein